MIQQYCAGLLEFPASNIRVTPAKLEAAAADDGLARPHACCYRKSQWSGQDDVTRDEVFRAWGRHPAAG